MNRNFKLINFREQIRSQITLSELGLEIGPSFNPIASKSNGYNVHIIDHLDKDGLIEKYLNHQNTPIENIEDVDYVWNGERYSKLIGNEKCYDYIIASHLIEHVPDLVDFINQCSELLKDDGKLFLLIPDKRFCFDIFQPCSNLSHIIDNHLSKNTKPTLGEVTSQLLNFVANNQQISWGKDSQKTNFHFIRNLEQINNTIENYSETYIDTHVWHFTPLSFQLLIFDLILLKYIEIDIERIEDTVGVEFLCVLSKSKNKSSKGLLDQRLELLNRSLIADEEHYKKNQILKNSAQYPNLSLEDLIYIIKSSGMFDGDYYLETNPDVKEAGIDPLEHFLMFGWKEDRQPK